MGLRRQRLLLIGLFTVVVYSGWELFSGAASNEDHSGVSSYDTVHESKGTSDTVAADPISEVAAAGTSPVVASGKLVPTAFGNAEQQEPPSKLPRIQHGFDHPSRAQEQRLAAVQEAFEHSCGPVTRSTPG